MKNIMKEKQARRDRRARRTRAKIQGTSARPRMSVSRTLKHVRVQLIDDATGTTLAQANDLDVKEKGTKSEVAGKVGTILAERAKAAGIETVVFDRGASRYHGRIKVLADAAREGGLNF